MHSQKGVERAKVLGKHLTARGDTRERKAPREHDWRIGEVEGMQVGGVPGK